MTSIIPEQPAPFAPLPRANVQIPNPRTVRADDFTWYNSRAGDIIKTSYNKCTDTITSKKYPWNRIPSLPNEPWPCQVPRFSLYGLVGTCPCQLNRCKCNSCQDKHRCALFGGSYVNPN